MFISLELRAHHELGAALRARLERVLVCLEGARIAEAEAILHGLIRLLPASEPRHRAAARGTQHEPDRARG